MTRTDIIVLSIALLATIIAIKLLPKPTYIDSVPPMISTSTTIVTFSDHPYHSHSSEPTFEVPVRITIRRTGETHFGLAKIDCSTQSYEITSKTTSIQLPKGKLQDFLLRFCNSIKSQ